jgi:hypothetical protein
MKELIDLEQLFDMFFLGQVDHRTDFKITRICFEFDGLDFISTSASRID